MPESRGPVEVCRWCPEPGHVYHGEQLGPTASGWRLPGQTNLEEIHAGRQHHRWRRHGVAFLGPVPQVVSGKQPT